MSKEIWKVTSSEWYELVENLVVFESREQAIEYLETVWSSFLNGENIEVLISTGDITIEQLNYWKPKEKVLECWENE